MKVKLPAPNPLPKPVRHGQHGQHAQSPPLSTSHTPKKVRYTLGGEHFVLYDHYIPIKVLGTGAYAIVIEARDTRHSPHRVVAIKKNKNVFVSLSDAKRILREMTVLMSVRHDDVIALLDVITPTANEISTFQDVYLVMPRMETTLKRIIRSDQKLTDRHLLFFTYQILRGLRYLHSAALVHRDLKPENILVNGRNCNVKISDFGLVTDVSHSGSENHPHLTEYVMTRWYRAPEVMVCAKRYGRAVDVWACGCILAELLLRRELFPGNNHFEQLSLIFSIIGSPKRHETSWITSVDAREWVLKLTPQSGEDLRKIFKNGRPEAIDLLSAMLRVNPKRRVRVEEALRHPYFAKLSHPGTERVFEGRRPVLQMEQLKGMGVEEVRRRMWQKMHSFEAPKVSRRKSKEGRQ